jgi:hypothetical protein
LRLNYLFAIAGLAALAPYSAVPARAQTAPQPYVRTTPQVAPRVRPRIEVNPPRLLYRRCADWYELQHRPSGTVLYPQMRCWWVRG